MTDKNTEVYELSPVTPTGYSNVAPKRDAASSQSRGLKVSESVEYISIPWI